MTRYIPPIVALMFAFVISADSGLSKQRKCVGASHKQAIEGDISAQVEEFTSTMAESKLYLKAITCDLGKPDVNVVVDAEASTVIVGKSAERGERYVAYGNPRTDAPVNENAVVFILNKDGFVRVMERYQPKKKTMWAMELGSEPGKVVLSFGSYTRDVTSRHSPE